MTSSYENRLPGSFDSSACGRAAAAGREKGRPVAGRTGAPASHLDEGRSGARIDRPDPAHRPWKDACKGEQGGLYPNGGNSVPPAHLKAGEKIARTVAPLDAGGKKSKDGKACCHSDGGSAVTL